MNSAAGEKQAWQRRMAVNKAVLRLVRLIRKRGSADEAEEAAALEKVITERLRRFQSRKIKTG